jgi:hypothetical protein
MQILMLLKWKSLNNSDASQNDLFSLVLMSTNYNDDGKEVVTRTAPGMRLTLMQAF